MKPICIIPVRSGSKGLPNKNMLFLDHKPLLFHTIDAALDSGLFEPKDIYISTDSELYKEIALSRGVSVVLRKPELATDTATSYEVLADFLADFPQEQTFVLLQATSPLRTGKQIKGAYDFYLESQAENVVSFSEVDKHPSLFTTLSEEGFPQDIVGLDKGYRRQNFQPLYYPNGAIYIASNGNYVEKASFFTEGTRAFLMSKETATDIDTKADFIHAIGALYFDYAKREYANKPVYAEQYKVLAKKNVKSKLIIGDSRMLDIQLEGFTNLSIGGVTLDTFLENSKEFSLDQVEEVFVSIGINDFITKYPMETIKENFLSLFKMFEGKKVYFTTIPYTLFRAEVDNKDVAKLNQWLKFYCQENEIPIFDTNLFVSDDGHLEYSKTNDGLHFKEEVSRELQERYQRFINMNQ